MSNKSNFKRMCEEAENAPAFSEEERRAEASIWAWNVSTNFKIWMNWPMIQEIKLNGIILQSMF